MGELASALRRAHGSAERALRDDVGVGLWRAFVVKTYGCTKKALAAPRKKDRPSPLIRAEDDIKGMVEAIATLEKAADAAKANVPRETGRPLLLPRDCIQGLARVYRSSTGLKPGRGSGPFAEFVSEFMIAVGQTKFEYESIIYAIKDAHRKFKPSNF